MFIKNFYRCLCPIVDGEGVAEDQQQQEDGADEGNVGEYGFLGGHWSGDGKDEGVGY